MVRVSDARVAAVAMAIGKLGLPAILRLEEATDPQYAALQRLAESVGRGVAEVYAVLVASVSYRLAMRGEEWWSCASEFLSSAQPPRDIEALGSRVEGFLMSCRGAVIGREGKISRVRRLVRGARDLLERLMTDPALPIRDPLSVHYAIAKALGSSREAKTIAFSVKMAYYAARPRGSLVPLLYNIPMPIDVRVACVSVTSGIVEVDRDYRVLVRQPTMAQQAWARISSISGVPTPHIDSLLWVVGWAPRDLGQAEAFRAIEATLSEVSTRDVASLVARELTYAPCR
ncbi:MAG: N-glycosylase/DNA lyase [Acidilobus sp.]